MSNEELAHEKAMDCAGPSVSGAPGSAIIVKAPQASALRASAPATTRPVPQVQMAGPAPQLVAVPSFAYVTPAVHPVIMANPVVPAVTASVITRLQERPTEHDAHTRRYATIHLCVEAVALGATCGLPMLDVPALLALIGASIVACRGCSYTTTKDAIGKNASSSYIWLSATSLGLSAFHITLLAWLATDPRNEEGAWGDRALACFLLALACILVVMRAAAVFVASRLRHAQGKETDRVSAGARIAGV